MLVSRCITCNPLISREHTGRHGRLLADMEVLQCNALRQVSDYVINQGFTSLRHSSFGLCELLQIQNIEHILLLYSPN